MWLVWGIKLVGVVEVPLRIAWSDLQNKDSCYPEAKSMADLLFLSSWQYNYSSKQANGSLQQKNSHHKIIFLRRSCLHWDLEACFWLSSPSICVGNLQHLYILLYIYIFWYSQEIYFSSWFFFFFFFTVTNERKVFFFFIKFVLCNFVQNLCKWIPDFDLPRYNSDDRMHQQNKSNCRKMSRVHKNK